jgi:hypothetical protein
VKYLPSSDKVEALRKRIAFLEKEIIHLKGEEKTAASKEYFKLLHQCKKECQTDEPIFIDRS